MQGKEGGVYYDRQQTGEICHAVKNLFPNYACSTLLPKYQNIPRGTLCQPL